MPTASLLRPLWDRADEWACRLAMIREAQRFLYLSTYYIEYDRYGVELLASLLEAQRRGVAVNLLVDNFGQRLGGVLMTRDTQAALVARLDELRHAGAVVAFYEPRYFLQRRLGGGQHVKIQVSEAGEAIFGSSNITKSSFEGWNEFSVSVRGPVVRTLFESYRAIGGSVDDDHLRQLAGVRSDTPDDMALDYWLCNPNTHQGRWGPLGWRGRNEVTDRIIDMLDGARDTVRLTSFYFKPVESLMTALIGAARRGVQVEVYHSHRDALPATDLAWIAAAVNYERLLDAGIEVHENRRGEHSKIVLVDDTWVAFGSYNFEDAAHDRLAEAMLATHDGRAIAHATSIFAELRRDPHNERVSDRFLRSLPGMLKLRRAVIGRFKRWM
ncbi:MAG: phosphatidylserine/phosphatidylglycerophosphate/cardiolipin synthase family protein [Vicinamibacterales bacterium]|nr:phosphatidylserine/phosphatidylglycerophosphate/cardiolipin synthase family protein [Vicinamibacterales bacterium]